MGAHSHRAVPAPAGAPIRIAVGIVVGLAVAALAAMVWLWPSDHPTSEGGPAAEFLGTIVSIEREECPEKLPDEVNGCGTAEVRLDGGDAGARAGETVRSPLPNGVGAPTVQTGDEVVLIEGGSPDTAAFTIVDHQRTTGLWVLAGAFVLALVAFARWRGLTALIGLGATFGVLLLFVLPAILAGESPVLVALVGSAVIMCTVLYLTHGTYASTTVAVLGTLVSLMLTGLLSVVAIAGLHLTGVTDDLSGAVSIGQGVNTQGLLLAGIVIGSLGVIDDVTVTQAVTVSELARANPRMSALAVYRAGSRVGRSHIASVVNTIVLAYAGTSLPLLILIVANDGTLGGVLTDQVIAQEIARSVVATLGLIAAVPITTGLAAWVATRGRSLADDPA